MFGCLESAKKMKEKEAEKKRETGELKASPKIYYDVDCCLQTLTLAYIVCRAREITKTNQNKGYYKGKKEKNQNGVV